MELCEEEFLALYHRLADADLTVWEAALPEFMAMSRHLRENMLTMLEYAATYREDKRFARSAPYRRAYRLLRTFLSPQQNARLTSHHYFLVRGSEGRMYALWPRVGMVYMVELHGKHWKWIARYCLHDFPEEGVKRIPTPDLSLQHLLWLVSDEAAFLATANVIPNRHVEWSGRWAREFQHIHKPGEQQRREVDVELERMNGPRVEGQRIRICLDTDVAA